MTYVPYPAANSVGDRFLALLGKLGIDPPAPSSLEDELLSLTQLIEIYKNPALATGNDRVSVWRTAAGVHDLAAKVLSVETISEFAQFVPHLSLIASRKLSKLSKPSIVQNEYSGLDDTARKIAELYLGCLAAHVGLGVTLDDPFKSSGGTNPDVMVHLKPDVGNPAHCALAIKTISSRQGQSIFENIEGGADQINHPSCTADFGMVVINAKNVIDHDAFWKPATPFADEACAMAALAAVLEALANNANWARPKSDWDNVFNRRAVRPVIFMGQTLVSLPTAHHQQTPTPLKMLLVYPAEGTPHAVAFNLAAQMNHFMQTILWGRPGSPGVLPS